MSMHYYPEISIHIVAGSFGLLLGLIPMFNRKGSEQHRRFGKLFAGLATVVMLSAVITIALRDKPSFVTLSRITLTSSYLLWGGWRALRMRDFGPRLIDAVVALSAAGLAGYFMLQHVPSSSVPIALANFTLYWLFSVILYDLSRYFWHEQWCAKVALIEHGVKMIAVFFAMLSAGAGNLLSQWQPWSILMPNLMGGLMMTGMALYYGRKPTARMPQGQSA